MRRRTDLAVIAALAAACPAQAQVAAPALAPDVWGDAPLPRAQPSLDEALLRGVYGLGEPAATTFRVLNATSYAAIAAVPAGLAVYAVADDEPYRPAVRAALSEAAAAGAVLAAKNVVRRPRPYAALPGIEARTGGTSPNASMPSGHSALAFAAATSLALSHPRAAVAVPAYAWASGVALARVWHGVHYPSDIAVGALVGAGVAYGVHRLVPDDAASGSGASASLAVPLGRVALRF